MKTPEIVLDPGYWFDGLVGARQAPRDPYLRWAVLTHFRNLKRNGRLAARLSFIVERRADSAGWSALRQIDGVSVPAVYDEPLAHGRISRFATVRVSTRGKDDAAVNQRLLALLTHPQVRRVQLGYPRGNELEAPESPAQRPPPPPGARQRAPVVLAVIDDGCPFAHPDLCDPSGQTRLVRLWQQSTFDVPTSSPDARWVPAASMGYGRMLDRAAMAALMAASRRGDEVEETLCYQTAFGVEESEFTDGSGRQWFKPSRAMLTRASHGGSVLAAAAGAPPRLNGLGVPGAGGAPLHGEPGDPASQCPLMFVDLPREQVEISSGRWLPINALDGLRFILSEARRAFERGPADEVPVVVNLSSGSTAGAHVGQAMLERAMDELLGADDRLAVTLAAGNSRLSESHARLKVPAGGEATVGLFIPPAQPFDTFVELWLPRRADLSALTVGVQSPDGVSLRVSSTQPEDSVGHDVRDRIAALMFFPQVVQATDRSMVLLVVRGTVAGPGSGERAAPGPWRVTVAHGGPASLTVQAWIERDEVVFGRYQPQAARFFSFDDSEQINQDLVRRDYTLSNIATGTRSFAVAAYQGAPDDGPMSDYSGAPDGSLPARFLPFAARADTGRSHPGVRVPGQRGSVNRRMNGTSVAAPQAARYLANQLARLPSRAAIEQALPPSPRPLPAQGLDAEPVIDPRDGRLRL